MATSKEIIQGLFEHVNIGCTGLYENIWPDTLIKWTRQGYPVDDQGLPQSPAALFGFDLGRLGAAFHPEPRLHHRALLERTDEWEIIEDGAGVTKKVWRNKSAPAGPIRYRMDGPQVWEAEFKPLLQKTEEGRVPDDALRAAFDSHRTAGRWTCFNMSFLWEDFRQSVGDICMYESLIDDVEWVKDYNDTALGFYMRHFEIAFEKVGMPDGVWLSEDLAYNQGLFCSPATLEALYLPFYHAFIEYLHEKGLKVILHSCGNIERALPLIVEAGFDALHPMQIRAGCDPFAIARQYKEKLVLLGGLDAHLLEKGNAAEIADMQIRLMEGMRDIGARYIFSSDHSVSTNVAYDTYRHVLDTYHAHCGR